MKSILTQVLLFAANANLGYRIFSHANKKFTNLFVRAFTKSDATGLCFGKPNYIPKNCYETANLIFRFLC